MTGTRHGARRRPCRALLLLWLVLVGGAPARGETVDGAVRMGTDAASPVWAGQQVTLNLDLMSTGFSFSGQHFLLPAVDGGFLMQTDSTTVKLTERRDEQTWQVLRYPIALFPQRAGPLTVPGFGVRFRASAGYGQEPQQFSYRTRPVTLQVRRPPGLGQEALAVTTTDLSVQAAWSPPAPRDDAAAAVRIGDAVSLTVSLRAADVSGMFLPALPAAPQAGLSAYPEPPVVADRMNRGRLEGARVEKVTWVFAEPGRYELPEIRYRWFDPQAGTLRERRIPGRRFQVAPVPDTTAAGAAAAPGRAPGAPWILPLGAGSFVAAAAAVLAWRRRRARTGGADVRAASERELYRTALRACRRGEPAAAYGALLRWAARRAGRPVALGAFAATCEPGFREEAEALQRTLIAGAGGEGWNGAPLVRKLRAQQRRRSTGGAGPRRLAPLNPGSSWPVPGAAGREC